MRTISVRLDDGSEARLDNLCLTLGLSQSEVVKAGLALLQQHSTSPAVLAERLGLVGSFSSAAADNGTASRARDRLKAAAQAGSPDRAAALSRSLFRGATLLDTGPLVAWFDRSDQDHEACAGFFQQHQGAFVSTWPVLTEVCHLIPADLAPRFLSWVSLGGLNLAELDGSALEWMASWMRQYGDLPMDLADASLLWVAQEHGIRRIATLDRRDFGIYRLPGGESLDNLLNP